MAKNAVVIVFAVFLYTVCVIHGQLWQQFIRFTQLINSKRNSRDADNLEMLKKYHKVLP